MSTSESVLQLINEYMLVQNPNIDKNILINEIFLEMHQIEWDIPAGKTVLLYSGNIMSDELVNMQSHFSRAYEIVGEMREANNSLFIDSDTGVGKVLSSDLYRIFKDQLAGEGRLPSDLAIIEHGLWTDASQQLASKAVGDVITISPFASLGGANGPTVFSSVEIPALLQNVNVTTIEGIPREALLEFADDIRGQALLSGATFEQADEIVRKELLDVVSAKSLANMTNNLEFSLDGTQSGIKVGSGFFPEGALGLGGGIDTTNGMLTETFGDIAKPLSDADFYRLAKSGTYLKALKTAGVYLGPVGDILEIAIAAVTIKSLYDAGDQEGVARESSKFAASFLAGSAGAAFAAELALPLLFGGPIGVVAYGLIVVGAGVASSVAGERTVDWLFNGGGGNFFGQDGQGLYVDVYQRGPDGRLYVTRARQRVGFDEIEIGTPGLSDQVEIVVTAQPDGSVRGAYIKLICPPLSGPETMIVWTTKGTMNAEQEAQAGRDYRQAA